MAIKRYFCIFLAMLILGGCAAHTPATGPSMPTDSTDFTRPDTTNPTRPNTTDPTQPAGADPGSDTAQADQEAIFRQLFNLENKITIRLDMDASELAKMQADYEHYRSFGSKSPIYRMADLEITIETELGATTYRISQVGVRMKGNSSRNDFYSDKDGIYSLIHLKISFQETFDDPDYYGADALQWSKEARAARKDRTFATLEKLDMKWNRCDDSSYIKEYYAYEMYRAYGVLAPHTNLASVDWSGLHMGVYTIYEPIDKIFLEKNLPGSQLGGDLYKLGWTNTGASFTDTSSIGIEDEDAGKFYCYDLKTNKKTSASESLIKLITALNRGSVGKDTFAGLVDVDYFLRYAAVSYFLGNPDDLRNNYNNCYIYFRGDTGQMLVIPYDYDRCLGVTKHWNPTGNGVTSDNPFSTTLAATGGKQENPLFLYSVCEGGYYVRDFAALLADMQNSQWLNVDHFLGSAALAQKHYAGETAPGKQFYNAGGYRFTMDPGKTSDFSSQDNISFADYVQAKRAALAQYLKDVDRYAAGAPQMPADLYIRADFTNWDVWEEWKMTLGDDGLWRIEISRNERIRFKVYSRVLNRWYGSECLAEDTAPDWQTDDHTNIILPAGDYLVVFDPESLTIVIT